MVCITKYLTEIQQNRNVSVFVFDTVMSLNIKDYLGDINYFSYCNRAQKCRSLIKQRQSTTPPNLQNVSFTKLAKWERALSCKRICIVSAQRFVLIVVPYSRKFTSRGPLNSKYTRIHMDRFRFLRQKGSTIFHC